MQAAQQHESTEPTSILARLEERGITASVEGTELRLTGPVGSLTPELKAAITSQGASLMSAMTGYAPLDRAIIQDEARKHSVEQIQERLTHCRQAAAAPGATPLHHQLVRDWAAILAAKERGADTDGPSLGDEVPHVG